jgi:hypothetical protein
MRTRLAHLLKFATTFCNETKAVNRVGFIAEGSHKV